MSGKAIVEQALAMGQRALTEFRSKQLLAAYGVPVCREILAADRQAAVRAAEEIGFPVVLKGCAPNLTHKTENGMVETGIGNAGQASRTAERLFANMPSSGTVLVQEMVDGRRELMLGMKRDAQYGPCVSFGLGGIFAEALDDVALCLAPVSEREAEALLDGIRASAMLGTYRGMPAVDRGALVEAIIGLGRIATDHVEIAEIDINPLIVNGARPIAVDALVVLAAVTVRR